MPRVLLVCLLAGCGRPALAGFVPSLELGVRFTQRGDADDQASSLTGFARLAFRPRPEADVLPASGAASGLVLAAPCADDDVACLDELAEAEREFGALSGDDR
jgi:hypothetical protein